MRLLSEGICWHREYPVNRCYSANATKSAFPAREQKELWSILSQERACVVGRGEGCCELQAVKPYVILKPLVDFPLWLLDNKRSSDTVRERTAFSITLFLSSWPLKKAQSKCQVTHLLFWFYIAFTLPLQKCKYPFEFVTPNQSEVRIAGFASK